MKWAVGSEEAGSGRIQGQGGGLLFYPPPLPPRPVARSPCLAPPLPVPGPGKVEQGVLT